MEKVKKLIEEWYEDEKIEERKKEVSKLFRETFGIEPQNAEVYDKRAFAIRCFSASEIEEVLGEEVMIKLEEIASSIVGIDRINSLILKVAEEPKATEESDWESYWGREIDHYDIVRSKSIKGYVIQLIVETPIGYDC